MKQGLGTHVSSAGCPSTQEASHRGFEIGCCKEYESPVVMMRDVSDRGQKTGR